MFSLFKKKEPPAPLEPTFKTRVARFWSWYASVAERFYQTIEDKRCGDLADEVSGKVDELIPGFAWVFGPGANGRGHSFTLSGEGNPHRQLLAAFWLAQAPKLPGWTFHASRQPSEASDLGHLEIDGEDFDPAAFWLTPSVNEEREEVDLTAWHPVFPKLDDRTRWTILFLFLDQALGEIGTQNWIGKIEMNDQKLAGAIPLAELRSFTEKLRVEKKWEKGEPGENWSSYQFEEPPGAMPRGDVLVGSTGIEPLINEFYGANGELADPLADTGADYVYVAFDVTHLPTGNEVDARGQIDDALDEELKKSAGGRTLGGAMGHQFAYIDLLIFDGAESLSTMRNVLRKLKLPAGASINYFAHEKRGHRLVL